ncbi:ferredoxin [Streptomyces halstedii]|uniref:ferredoxin n=1 Tax=Streptomyces TaxID=1883 RepID=UPI0004A92BBA|nr:MULTISPECIES: ferredoxin [Streptomyces]MYQ53266.1 ferredoxin [Streptomyces sp. SID4941]MYR73674.1 ferredoxin [Streptomyces sp. SID4925]MYY18577.1 ferredoxin [Streptomyces sp. SID4912]WSX40181.1 ferredoxin [Streptomyces halstedii]KDQ65582.1 cytochrome P450 [Streptomyces sp. NTK 937]
MRAVSWTTEVDRGLCMGSGMCAGLAPELYRLDDEGRAAPLRDRITPDERALDAADSCPAAAILVREGGQLIGPRP